jgi:hypothetical protein
MAYLDPPQASDAIIKRWGAYRFVYKCTLDMQICIESRRTDAHVCDEK